MNYKYKLYAVLNGEQVNVRRKFSSRNKAMNKVVSYLDEYGLEIDRVNVKEDKHHLEYVCNDQSRFFVNRIAEK